MAMLLAKTCYSSTTQVERRYNQALAVTVIFEVSDRRSRTLDSQSEISGMTLSPYIITFAALFISLEIFIGSEIRRYEAFSNTGRSKDPMMRNKKALV